MFPCIDIPPADRLPVAGEAQPRLLSRLARRQLLTHIPELLKRSLKILNYLGSDLLRRRQVRRILKTVILQPEDIEVQLIASLQLVVAEALEPLILFPLRTIS